MVEAVLTSKEPPVAANENRLKAFMGLNGIQTSGELAQVFRVTQDTTARWIKNADSKPLEDVMQGPALILFELMEEGLETRELLVMREMAAFQKNPAGIEDLNAEEKWKVTLGNRSRLGVRIENKEGFFIIVHSGWLKDRISALGLIAEQTQQKARQKRALVLSSRYEDALQGLAELPR